MVKYILVGFVVEYCIPVKKNEVALMGWYEQMSTTDGWIRKGSYGVMPTARLCDIHPFLCVLVHTGPGGSAQGEVRDQAPETDLVLNSSSLLINTGSGQITCLAELPFPHR